MGMLSCKKKKEKILVKENKEPKKDNNNFKDVLDDIGDIGNVQIKGEMLFSETNGKPKDHYEILETIATGPLGNTKRVKNKFSGCIRSLKLIKKALIDLQEDEKFFMKEIAMLRTLDHLNILKIYEFYQDEKCFYLISEYCSGGDLFDKIKEKGKFSEYSAAYIIYQILSAVFYCHSANIVHRDIKADCIFIESIEIDKIENGEEVEFYNIRLSDFSSARSFVKNKKLTKKIGTPYYIAPEVLKRNYNEKCDVWSIGVLLYILLTGKPPFNGETDKEILKKVEDGIIEKKDEDLRGIGTEAKHFLDQMLKTLPDKRISIEDAIKHPWIKKFCIKRKLPAEKVQEFYKNITSFKIDPQYFFQQATLAFMVHHLSTKEEVDPIRQMFFYIDVNGDGRMAYSEIVDGFKKFINVNEKDLLRVFKYIDQAKTGSIEFEEFVRACIDKYRLLTPEFLKSTFALFTKDGNAEISPSDFKYFLGLQSKFSDKQWEQIIKNVDKDGNGQIDYGEFEEMMMEFLKD